MSWFASKNRSLLAARCLVECVIASYMRGDCFSDMQMSISMGALSAEAGGGVLSRSFPPADQQVLQSWIALVMLTLEEVGVQRASSSGDEGASASASGGGGGARGSSDSYLKGMRTYMQQTLKMYQEGYTLERLQRLQAIVSQGPPSEFSAMMQQYTRLVLLTLEVVAVQGLSCTAVPLSNPTSIPSITGYAVGISGGSAEASTQQPGTSNRTDISASATSSTDASISDTSSTASSSSSSNDRDPGGAGGSRGQSLQMLLAFMGASLGSEFSRDCFVQLVLAAYSQGCSAGAIVRQLQAEDFDQTGGLVPVGLPALGVEPTINKQLFARWVSIVYFALTHLGACFDGPQQPGWAWAGVAAIQDSAEADSPSSSDPASAFGIAEDDAVTAVGLDAFVQNALKRAADRLAEQEEEEGAGHALRQQVEEDADGSSSSSRASSTADESSGRSSKAAAAALLPPLPDSDKDLLERMQQSPESVSLMEQDRERSSVLYREQGLLRGRNVPPLVRLEDDNLTQGTSSAYLIMSQQVDLVARTLELYTQAISSSSLVAA